MTPGYLFFLAIVAVLCAGVSVYDDNPVAGAAAGICLGMFFWNWLAP
jgi:hypothetical protein